MDSVKPPRTVAEAAAEDPLAVLISAAKAGRLVALLRGEGLTEHTVRELLMPESAERLRAYLNEGVFSVRDTPNPSPESQPTRFRHGGGNVLVFSKPRETFRSRSWR
jgi:hypothetical protein